MVRLDKSMYQGTESVGTIEVCARVESPSVSCPIRMPFSVHISTIDDTAGTNSNIYSTSNVSAVLKEHIHSKTVHETNNLHVLHITFEHFTFEHSIYSIILTSVLGYADRLHFSSLCYIVT